MAEVTPRQLAQIAENAYDARDREALRLALARLVALAELALKPAPPPIDPSD